MSSTSERAGFALNAGAQEILAYYLGSKPCSADVSAEMFARKTPGFAGAQLANMVNEAALAAAKGGGKEVTSALLDEARDKVMMGRERTLVRTAVRCLIYQNLQGIGTLLHIHGFDWCLALINAITGWQSAHVQTVVRCSVSALRSGGNQLMHSAVLFCCLSHKLRRHNSVHARRSRCMLCGQSLAALQVRYACPACSVGSCCGALKIINSCPQWYTLAGGSSEHSIP